MALSSVEDQKKMSQGLPPSVQHFIADHIDSIEQLEVLLLLAKDVNRWWSVEELSVELRSTPRSIRKRLDDLCFLKLARRNEGEPERFAYLVADAKLAETVSELARLYRQYRLAVVDLIFRKPRNKMLKFSQAFRLKGDDDAG